MPEPMKLKARKLSRFDCRSAAREEEDSEDNCEDHRTDRAACVTSKMLPANHDLVL